MINYASFAVSYMRGKMEGQRQDRDMFNKPIDPSATVEIVEEPIEAHDE